MGFAQRSFAQLRDAAFRRDSFEPSLVTQAAANGMAEHLNAACAHAWLYFPWRDSRRVSTAAPSGANSRYLDPAGPLATTGHRYYEVLGVFRDDPLVYSRPREIPVRLASDGYYLVGDAPPETVYVVWRTEPPRFTAEPQVSGHEYAAGEITFNPTTGDCYRSVSDGNSNPAPGVSWAYERLPATLEQAVLLMTQAGMRREDGQGMAALALEEQADMLLAAACTAEMERENQAVYARR